MPKLTSEDFQKTRAVFQEGIPLFQVLSETARQDILLYLADYGELNVNELTEKLTLSRPAVSHHLKVLRQAGLIGVRSAGTGNYYYLRMKKPLELLKELAFLIEKNCEIRE